MNEIVSHEKLLPATMGGISTGKAVRAIVPANIEDAFRIAKMVTTAGMAPKGLETAEKVMVAIMHGMEVGMTPMAALQSIAVVNGRPTIWGDGALGLVQGSGLMEWHKEWYEGTGDTRKAFCTVKRRGDPEVKTGEFSVADAKKASLWGKTGPWTQYADRMLKMRARGFALRDGFSDVLRGLGITEEVQDTPMRDVTPSVDRPQPPRPPAPPVAAQVVEVTPEPADEPQFDLGDYLDEVETSLASAKSAEMVAELYDEFDPEAVLESEGHGDMVETVRNLRTRFLLNFAPIAGG